MLSERLLGGLLPARWAAPVWRPAGEQLVLINWLYTEIDPRGEERWPILRELRGWRNVEVHEIVVGINSFDWTQDYSLWRIWRGPMRIFVARRSGPLHS